MKLNKNERKTLKLLLDNAKISDSAIANQLHISSQAVGKIRKKLEKTVINSYSLALDYAKLGVQTFALSVSKITAEGLDEGELEVEERLLKDPHVISLYRLPRGSATHVIMYGFRDINELETFFNSPQKRRDLHRFIENKELFTFSHHSVIKNNPAPLFHKFINNMEAEALKNKFEEIENFKRGMGR